MSRWLPRRRPRRERSPSGLWLVTLWVPLPDFGRVSPTDLVRLGFYGWKCLKLYRMVASLRVIRPNLTQGADVQPSAAERLLQQRKEAVPLGLLERVAPRH